MAGGIAAAIVMPRLREQPVSQESGGRRVRGVDTIIVQAAPSTIDLALEATAVPLMSQQIHARASGVVESVVVSLGERVTRGQPLATMAVKLPATEEAPALGAVDTFIAPFDGLVTRRNLEVGQAVTAESGALLEISDVSTLKAHVDVPQTLAPWVHVGEAVAVTARAVSYATIAGKVARTAGALDPVTHVLRIEVQMPGERLLAGTAVMVRFSVRREVTPPMIPARALVFGTKWPRVVRVMDGRAHFQTIELGWDRGSDVEIARGVEAGDVVVLSPPDNIREGEPLLLNDDRATAAR